MKILITGGAGFIGSSLALAFKSEDPSAEVVALDNLRRRGAELNLARFRQAGVKFVHGDIRHQSDLDELDGNFDLFIEASAEPSVLAGVTSSPQYVLQTNLMGTLNCLEFARRRAGSFVFLSTSRVYSLRPLGEINLVETDSRFEIGAGQGYAGISAAGVAEDFPVHLPRSLYGATKLASELIIQEYVETYGLRAVINRCGVVAGPGQFGKVDQGVFTLWVAKHFYLQPLTYTGFGGEGKQVRDLLHPADLFALIKEQLAGIEAHAGGIFNIGGGRAASTSLLELTAVCREVTGNEVPIASDPETSSVDIPLYISDCRKAAGSFSWTPERPVKVIVEDIFDWLRHNEAELEPLFT
jgi:CDP-paratose 2-epimerase